MRPMVNGMVLLYALLFHNFGLSILAFTVIVRLLTLPLTRRQARQMKAMSTLQPKIKEIQQKHANDKQKVSQETMRLYREQGVNPLGCLGPMVIQFPIWIGLYQTIISTLPTTPDYLVGLSERLYSWLPLVHTVVPVNGNFLWLNLALPDPTPVLPVLVGASMWMQTKMTAMPTADPRQQSTNTMMQWMMPLMLAFFAFQFPSGLALYIFTSTLIGVVIQYHVSGWGSLFTRAQAKPTGVVSAPAEENGNHGEQRAAGSSSQDGGGGNRARTKRARRRTRRSRSRGH